MKILAFAATNHKDSINKKLIAYSINLLKDSILPAAEIETLDLMHYELPLYRQDREAEGGIPKLATQFYEKIGASDAVIISFAEHNGSYTAVYKNLFDWMSRIDQNVYQNKPIIVMSTSPGDRGGMGVLGTVKTAAPFFGMDILASVSVPNFQKNIDEATGEINNPQIKQAIKTALLELTSKNRCKVTLNP